MKLIEAKEIITEKVQLLLDTFGDRPYETLIHHETIEALLGMDRYTESWCRIVEVFRQRVRERRGIHVEAVTGTGFRFQTPVETVVDEFGRRMRKAGRAGHRTEKILSAVPIHVLSDHLQQRRAMGIAHANLQKRIARRCRREHNTAFAVRETTPQIRQAKQA